jgi:hypothetical protein
MTFVIAIFGGPFISAESFLLAVDIVTFVGVAVAKYF